MPFDSNVLLHVKVGDTGEADIQQQVIRCDIEDIDRGSDKATLLVDNQAGANAVALQPGMQVRIDMGWETEYAFLFHGRIQSVRSTSDASHPQRLTVTCLDLSWDLNRDPPQEGRQHAGTLAQIVADLAGDIPVGGVTLDPMPSWTETRRLNQGARTAWQLLQYLAEEYRARAFVEVNGTPGDEDSPAEGTAQLYFMSETSLLSATPLGRLLKCPGYSNLIEFNVRHVGSGAAPTAAVTVADPQTGAAVAEAGTEPAADAPAAVDSQQAAELENTVGSARAADADAAAEIANSATVRPAQTRARTQLTGAPSDPDRARRRIEKDKTRLLGLFGNGLTTGSIFLRAKGSVLIEGIGTGQEGQWYLRKVNHIVERSTIEGRTRSTYRTRFEATR